MSCFMMHPEAIAAIADGMEKGLNMGYNFLGLDAPESLHIELRDCADKYGFYNAAEIYVKLYELNDCAYSGRYPDHDNTHTVPPMPEIPVLLHHAEWNGASQCYEVGEEHFKYFKLLDCFVYQCAEDATKNNPLFRAVIDWHKDWMRFLIRNNPTFAALPWGRL